MSGYKKKCNDIKKNTKIACGNNVERNDGLRDVPLIKATNTKAIPIAAPPNPNTNIEDATITFLVLPKSTLF